MVTTTVFQRRPPPSRRSAILVLGLCFALVAIPPVVLLTTLLPRGGDSAPPPPPSHEEVSAAIDRLRQEVVWAGTVGLSDDRAEAMLAVLLAGPPASDDECRWAAGSAKAAAWELAKLRARGPAPARLAPSLAEVFTRNGLPHRRAWLPSGAVEEPVFLVEAGPHLLGNAVHAGDPRGLTRDEAAARNIAWLDDGSALWEPAALAGRHGLETAFLAECQRLAARAWIHELGGWQWDEPEVTANGREARWRFYKPRGNTRWLTLTVEEARDGGAWRLRARLE